MQIKLHMDMVEMTMQPGFSRLSNRASQMQAQMVKSIFNLRFNHDAAGTSHPVFVAEYDRGVCLRSIFFSSRVIEHHGLLQDAVYATSAAQVDWTCTCSIYMCRVREESNFERRAIRRSQTNRCPP